MKIKRIRKFWMWIFKNEWIPLGKLAPYVLGLALGSKPHRVKQKDHDEEWKNVRDAYGGEVKHIKSADKNAK